jgi:hypothetical protein
MKPMRAAGNGDLRSASALLLAWRHRDMHGLTTLLSELGDQERDIITALLVLSDIDPTDVMLNTIIMKSLLAS